MDPEAERAWRELVAELAEHLRWEHSVGGDGVPRAEGEAASVRDAREGAPAVAGGSAPASEQSWAGGEAPALALIRQLRGGGASATAVKPAPAKVEAAPQVPAKPARGPEPTREPAASAVLPAALASEATARTNEPEGSGPPSEADRARARTRLEVLAGETRACVRCRLHEGRTQAVFARGSGASGVLFVGEGPGANEDHEGVPFVGPAGQLLDKMVAAMGVARDDAYVCNVVKCRPPENRTPLPDETAACMPFLREQIELVAPRVIVALGRCAAESLGCAMPGRSWRGIWGSYAGIPVMPTYHPAYLLRSPDMKRPVWEDLQRVMERLGGRAGGGA